MASKGVSGFNGQPRMQAQFSGLGQQLARVPDLDVDGTAVGACLPERLEVVAGVGHHQVAVEENAGVFSERFDDWRPDGEVGHEMGVHDVHMEPIGLRGNGGH